MIAHFVHTEVPHSGEFISSNSLLNAIQHATQYACSLFSLTLWLTNFHLISVQAVVPCWGRFSSDF